MASFDGDSQASDAPDVEEPLLSPTAVMILMMSLLVVGVLGIGIVVI